MKFERIVETVDKLIDICLKLCSSDVYAVIFLEQKKFILFHVK